MQAIRRAVIMFAIYTIAFFISCVGISAQTTEADVRKNSQEDGNSPAYIFPPGDARICLDIGLKTNFPLRRFSSLPGIGWDNLRNEAAGQVYDYNYAMCRTTEDGRYLTPDSVFTIPVKSSQVQTFAEIYDSWNDVTSITSRSINVDGSFKQGKGSISGSFSLEHSRVKRKQIQDNTVASRVQLRYLRYKAKLQPGSPLHPLFKSRLFSIVADLNQNLTQSAFYKAQLLVRDYGTHVLTNVVSGACLVKTDFLSQSYVASHDADKTVVTAAASASFSDVFKLDASFKQNTDSNDASSYRKNTKFSFLTTYGGPIYRPYDMTVSQWVDDVDDELVPMDRSGDPLYFTITTDMFPGVPVPLIERLEENVRDAVDQYYEMNTIRGCTKRQSPNFSYAANIDDGSCVSTSENINFGGVYQTCTVSGSYISSNPCNGMSQDNPLTKSKSCPPHYKSILLHSGVKLGQQESSKNCRGCGLFWLDTCCVTTYFQGRGHYSTYWCAAMGQAKQSTFLSIFSPSGNNTIPGYLFGGIWSSQSTNLVTKTKNCPPHFYPLRILQEYHLCVSDDHQLGGPHSLPFGGFISCSVGNPMAFQLTGDSKTKHFIEESNNWPKRCPDGFSQHLAAVDDRCEIQYCIRTGALSGKSLIPLRRPPFSSKPETIRKAEVLTIINDDNSIREDGMVVPKHVYDKAVDGESIASPEPSEALNPKGSGSVALLPSSLLTVFIPMVDLVWTKFYA